MEEKGLDKAKERIYNCIYKYSGKTVTGEIRWSALKNVRLKLTRRISFEEVIKGDLLGLGNNPRYSHQRILIFAFKNYFWAVPFVFDGEDIFLKTIYPSRKYKRHYRKG